MDLFSPAGVTFISGHPCTGSSYGFNPKPPTVEMAGEDRRTWEFNREAHRKHERMLERQGRVPGGD